MKKIFLLSVLIVSMIIPTITAGAAAAPVTVKVDGKVVSFPDAKPIIEDNRTLIPIRFVAESLGAKVEWINHKRIVEITGKNSTIIELKIGESMALIDRRIKKEFDTKAIIKNDRTYVPLRFISETFGSLVTWDDKTRIAYISEQEFIEPVITAVQRPDKWRYWHLKIELSNYYMMTTDYEFQFECINYPQLNTVEQEWAEGQWDTYNLTGWRNLGDVGDEIYVLMMKNYTTRENMKTLKITDGMKIEYVVRVRQISTGIVKEYPGTAVVHIQNFE